LLMESMRAWMNLQKKYWKSDADGNAGIEDGSLRICKLMVIMSELLGNKLPEHLKSGGIRACEKISVN